MDLAFDPYYNPYPSRRNVLYAARGMVCTSHPLAAQAGLEMLKKGGNAVDAAVATAAALTVVEPTSNGIGSDAFALVWQDGRLRGLNASGPAPAALDLDTVRAKGWGAADGRLPALGWAPVTVPGAPAAWAELTRECGRLTLADTLAPAINIAAEGHAVSLTVALYWQRAYQRYSAGFPGVDPAVFAQWFRVFADDGRTPVPGETWHAPDLARTLGRIAESGARDFYEGVLAGQIVESAVKTGGFLRAGDLRDFAPEWVQPISVPYKGYDVWEIPPNGQGLAALMALNMLGGYKPTHHDDPELVHRQLEAMKLAFADAHAYIADQRFVTVQVQALLDPAYAGRQASLITGTAQDFKSGTPIPGGTVYLCTADSDGTMVSYIQSNYMGFGSGVVVPGTGIALNNRGNCFSLKEGHPNALMPGKRPYNTIIPGFLSKDGRAVGPFGVMGGFMQPQGHLQVVMNSVDFGMNPQQALDAPRWQWIKALEAELECSFGEDVLRNLERRGHRVRFQSDSGNFGRGQIIWKHDAGGYVGGTESRADGSIAAW